jgi:Na+/citrate or Na+/malate symporter
MICAFFIVGGLLEKVVHIPGPVLMILAAVFCKYAKVIPAAMELGAHSCYKFVSAALVWPLMIGLGCCMYRWRAWYRSSRWLRRGLRLNCHCHGAERVSLSLHV